MSEIFTVEEVNLICIFNIGNRETLIAELISATADFEDVEMLEIAVAVLDKLSQMSDEDFAALELYPVYEDSDDEQEG